MKALIIWTGILLYGSGNAFAQLKATTGIYDTTAKELEDIQNLIAETFPEIEDQLLQGDSIYPFAAVLTADDSVGVIKARPKDKKTNPTTDELVALLKEELNIPALKGNYKVILLIYKVLVTDPATMNETEAIAVFAEHTNDDFAYLFYYPYLLKEKQIVYGNSFGDFAPQEMYNPN